jgi:hypothetical protein
MSLAVPLSGTRFITFLEVHYLLGLPPEQPVCIPYPGEEMLILSAIGAVATEQRYC